MARFESTITIQGNEYRPCYVDKGTEGKKALFHRWTEYGTIQNVKMLDTRLTEKSIKRIKEKISKGIITTPANVEIIRVIYGIVEYENGKIEEVAPSRICFADNKIREYVFNEV